MVDDCMLDNVKAQAIIIGIEQFENTKILIDADVTLPVDITFKNVAILITCIIKDSDKFYPQLYLEEALLA